MKLKKIAQVISLLCIAGTAAAQQTPPTPPGQTPDKKPQTIEKVTVTGSSIKRVVDEANVPLQIITAADIQKLGITSAEQLLATISASGNGIDNMTTNQGSDFLNSTSSRSLPNNGAAGANLRGLGAQYTLVLLNGRRTTSHALNGKSVDLNSIPLAAIERVEILKDGASAIYGTDAIGGVVNFILKKDYTGLEVTAFGDVTEHQYGNIYRGSILGGFGNLSRDKYNVMASLTFDTNGRLRGSQREFHNGYQPGRGLAPDTTGTPFANLGTGGGTAIRSAINNLPGFPAVTNGYSRVSLLALQGKCDTIANSYIYRGDITGFPRLNAACVFDYGKEWSLLQPVERTNVVTRGSFALSNDTTAFAEFVGSRVKSAVEYTPIQITNQNYPAFIVNAGGQTVRSPYYLDLTGLVPGFDNTKPERIRWRCLECGPRQQDTTTDTYRALIGVDGMVAGWDYKVGLSSAQSKASTLLGEGYMYRDPIYAALTSGLINPFLLPGQTQTQVATNLVNAAKAKGLSLYGGQGSTKELDGSFSKELFALPAGPLAVALGFDLRKENYRFKQDQANQPPILGVSAPSSLNDVSRDIKAVYGELQIPVIKNLDVQVAVRYDKYNDFGSTTNPKVAARWAPMPELAFRSSYSTGFHAPDFDALYGGVTTGQFNSDINDPVTCPNGIPAAGFNTDGCGIRPIINGVSNPKLKAEKSKQFSFGFVLQPAPWFSASVDFWKIELTDRIGALSGQALVANYDQYKQYVIRVGGQIDSVISPTFNLAGDKVRGADVNLTGNWTSDIGKFVATLDGTYTQSFKSRFSAADPYTELVGNFGNTTNGFDLHVSWKHTASVTWSQGPWSSTLSQHYTAGYQSERDGFGAGFTSPLAPSRVDSYTLFNLTGTYTGFKNLTITAGIRNLLDTKPSFSAHNVDNVAGAGWDARVGDPRLRSLILRLNYKF